MGSRKKPTGFSRTTGEEGSRGVSARERWVVAPKLTVSKFSPSTDGATEAPEAERATKPAPLCGRPPGVMGCQGPAEAGGQGCPGGRHPPGGLWDPPRAGALTGGVVEVQGHLLAAHCHAGRVFLEYGWGVMLLMRGSGWFLGMWRRPGVQLDSSPLPPSPHSAQLPHPRALEFPRETPRGAADFPRSGRRKPGVRARAAGRGPSLVPSGPEPDPRRPPASSTPEGLTSGKEPWLYTMSSEVLPHPPSPTITIFSSFLPGPGAAVGAGVSGTSIAGSRRHWQRCAGQSPG